MGVRGLGGEGGGITQPYKHAPAAPPLRYLLFLSPTLIQTYVTRLSSPNTTSCTVTPPPTPPFP